MKTEREREKGKVFSLGWGVYTHLLVSMYLPMMVVCKRTHSTASASSFFYTVRTVHLHERKKEQHENTRMHCMHSDIVKAPRGHLYLPFSSQEKKRDTTFFSLHSLSSLESDDGWLTFFWRRTGNSLGSRDLPPLHTITRVCSTDNKKAWRHQHPLSPPSIPSPGYHVYTDILERERDTM